MKRGSACLALIVTLGGCGGGGGGGGTTTPTPPPSPPPNPPDDDGEITFTEIPGFERSFGSVAGLTRVQIESGGVAGADYDGDGDVDFFVVGGNTAPNHLYQNQGDGTFLEVAATVGLDIVNWGSGPAFGDIDGDGDLDLFVGAVAGDRISLFENRVHEAERAFVDITPESGIALTASSTISATFFDYDTDGYPDLFLAHWGVLRAPGEDTETVWRNNGDGTFTNRSLETGVAEALVIPREGTDWSFSFNFSDIDGDGDNDLLLCSDFVTSQVHLNNGDGTFTDITDRAVIVDQNGMGGAVADFDHDGDMDWFVTSIYDLDYGGNRFGNRLYRNSGGGVFEDVTLEPVDDGAWGWGTCAADFDNDTHVDIVHVNGWLYEDDNGKSYQNIPVRFFHNQGSNDMRFRERAVEFGLENDSEGRGIVCFDADRDGDVDLVISNNFVDNVVFYRNDTDNDNHYLSIRLAGKGANTFGVGAHVAVATDEVTQVRELGGTSNYVSHNPLEAHVGLGSAAVASVTVRWPDGTTTTLDAVEANQLLTISQP